MKALAQELDIADIVTVTARVPDDEKLALLSTADVCVSPDFGNGMNDKSTMNKTMEYMALGKPVWHHEAPKLIAACEALWRGEALSPAERGVEI